MLKLKTKKILCLFIVLIFLLCSMSSFTVIAATSNDIMLDITNNEFDKEDVLTVLGVFTENDHNQNWDNIIVSKIDALVAICSLLGVDSGYQAVGVLPYNDIIPGYEYEWAIGYAYDYKLIPSASKFNAQQPATNVFIAEVLCNALGYGYRATAQGNWNGITEYRQICNQASSKVSLNELINVLYYAASLNMCEISAITGDSFILDTDGYETLLEKYRDMYFVDGRVVATEVASITGTRLGGNQIKIDDVVYQCETSMYGFIGHEVDALMQVDPSGDIDTLIYAFVNDKQDVVQISPENFEKYSNKTVYYTNEKGKSKRLNLSKSAVIIYNGQDVSGSQYKPEIFDVVDGSITVIGNDVISIKSYENIVVNSISNNQNDSIVIYDRADATKSVIFNTDDAIVFDVKDINGEKIGVEKIIFGSLITYAKSLSGEIVEIFVSNNKKEESFSTISTEADYYIVTVDENEYVLNKRDCKVQLSLGTTYELYFTYDGKIGAIFYSADINEKIKGFMTAAAVEEGLNSVCMVRVLPNDVAAEEEITLTLAEKVTIDGVRYKDSEKMEEALRKFAMERGESDFTPIPFVYKLNSEGNITYIDTPYTNSNKEVGETLELLYDRNDGELLFKNMSGYSSDGTFNLKYYAEPGVMYVNYNGLEDEFYIGKYTSEKKVTADLFSIGADTNEVVIAVAYVDGAATPVYEKNFGVVLDNSTKIWLEDEDEVVTKIDMLYDGKLQSFYTSLSKRSSIPATLKSGDVVKVQFDVKGRILNIEEPFVLSASTLKSGKSYTGSVSSDMFSPDEAKISTGTIYDVVVKNGNVFIRYFLSDSNDLSVYMVRSGATSSWLLDNTDSRNGRYNATQLTSENASSIIKGYKNHGDAADVILTRHTYWVPAQAIIIRKTR